MQRLAKYATPQAVKRKVISVPEAVQVPTTTALGCWPSDTRLSSANTCPGRPCPAGQPPAHSQVTREAEQLVFEGPLGRSVLPLAKIDSAGTSALQVGPARACCSCLEPGQGAWQDRMQPDS